MFDPQVQFDSKSGIRSPSLTALDKEIVKLLISNLDANIANAAFRHQLLDTYRNQLNQQIFS